MSPDFKKLAKTLQRASAAGGILFTLNNAIHPHDATPSLSRQFASYNKEVRAPETRREIRRTTTKTYNPTATLDPRTTRKLRKK